MAKSDSNITIRVRVLNPQKQPLGGTVNIDCRPEVAGKTISIKAADASKDIDVSGLLRGPKGVYQVIVTPTDVAKPASQFVKIPATGFNTVEFVIDKAVAGKLADPTKPTPVPSPIPSPIQRPIPIPVPTPIPNPIPVPTPTDPGAKYTVQGTLTFDNGLPASGIVTRIYNVVFGGKDMQLGQATSDAQGNYAVSFQVASGQSPNIQVRVVNASNQEVTISTTQFKAQSSLTLNLVVPSSVQPPAPEFQRLAADMEKSIGGVASLAAAVEGANRQDFTLLNQATNWDARLLTLAATASQQTQATGLGQDVLYALYRVGLPTDPTQLAQVPVATIQSALTKANQSGIVSMNDQQIAAAAKSFQGFSLSAKLAMKTPGAVSTFNDLISVHLADSPLQTAFANLYFSDPTSPDLWAQAAQLNIPAQTLDQLKLQGDLLYVTFNHSGLTQMLQNEIGSQANLSQLVDKGYDSPAAWQNALNSLAGKGGDQALAALIPTIYTGNTTADRLAAYSADMARIARMSYPNNSAANTIKNKQVTLNEKTAATVTNFLQVAGPLGYTLGRTPLNAFLKSAAQNLPALDADSLATVKKYHALQQTTTSTESFVAAYNAGFTSARDIASYSKDEFLSKYGSLFPSGEAKLVYGRSQVISSVAFNIFTSAKQLDNQPAVYGISGSDDSRQAAKNSIVQQFPSMASLFGNMDYCQCEDCRSVLSPAAYFVDVLEFLNGPAKNPSVNPAGFTPLDVLIGKPGSSVTGRRPDLGALPLTCENTNTAMPYIDIVNEILEYYIAHNNKLDTSLAYDTGNATTADLTAEPQNILPQVYNDQLKGAVFPLNLPFDLWIETVRGFLNYFQTPLAQVLDTLRPVDNLELFTDASSFPYYRAQILAEGLGLSPSEYAVLTNTDPTRHPLSAHWFELFGYTSEAIALHGVPDPTDPTQYKTPPLSSAKNLAQLLGVTYQDLTDLVKTGFLNPKLYPLLFQFERFGISMSDAFSYSGQPGYPAMTDVTAFEAALQKITTQYTTQNSSSTFDARTWLKNTLTANYSTGVMVLATPNSGCNFGTTSLQYADNTTAATPLDFVKINLFVRLWKKLGWTMDEVDRALQLFFPGSLPAWGDPGFDAAFSASWKTALVYLAHLDDLNTRLTPALGRTALLPFWSDLPVQGENPLYAQLFLTPSVLNNDWAFDDPNGIFPSPLSDFAAPPPFPPLTAFSTHQSSVQGVLGLTADEITAIFADASATSTMVSYVQNTQTVTVPSFTLTNLSICYRYSALAKCLQLPVKDMIALKAMAASSISPAPPAGLDPFQALSGTPLSTLADDLLFNQTLMFVQEVAAVQKSGFTVEDLKYLLRQQFDPVGKYRTDPNALMTVVLSITNGLHQIQTQNAVPANLASLAESLLDQLLSTLFPSAVLKNLFSLLTNSQTYTGQATFTTAVDTTPFSQETELTFAFDDVKDQETITYPGYLTDWKKVQLKGMSGAISSMLDMVQANAQAAFAQRMDDVLGVWASMVQYEAVKSGVMAAIPPDQLVQTDPAISLSYDQTGQLQWLGYRGVLTDKKQQALLGVLTSADLTALLADIQGQTATSYSQLTGSILAMWTNAQTYQASQTGVATADQIDVGAFFDALAAARQAGTITDPVPQLQFSYAGGTQTLICQGVLTAPMQAKLGGLITSTVLPGLLSAVQTQAVSLFQSLAANFLTVTSADLDKYAFPFVGLDITQQQTQVKAALISAFLPLLAQKLSQQLVVQTLAANLGADPSLITPLITDAALLSDPSNPGKSLIGSFMLNHQGVSATYYDGAGNVLTNGTAVTVDTADPSNSVAGAVKAHFEGYLQVPTDGPYRFFAEIGDVGATAQLELDPPDPSALLDNPIIQGTPATAAPSEVSQFVQLKGGALYHFSVDFSAVGSHGAKLLIQGETVTKGPLSQITLYPEQSLIAFTRAKTLLAKVLQILAVTNLDDREINYLMENSSQFNNLRLSSLPTQPSDDSAANAISLFSQFLALADYADLRQGPAGGTDGLIDVFQGVGQVFTEAVTSQDTNNNSSTPWTGLANLTRRDAATVRAIAEYFGLITNVVVGANRQVTAIGDFGNDKGVRRIWQALQLLQIAGIPVTSLTASTVIASAAPPAGSPSFDVIAENFKNSVKAQYTADNWRPVAQSVFDKLRQKKRDALVAYLIQTMPLENSNQLFEYFLVDPGMEPVVQTSRLRLAMSSVQTFVQRCLLNLENANTNTDVNVKPSQIDADWWSWMKRYRVWQANREIFLFPENWMEPELRLDKTDLFEQLESDLLQGNVTQDLAEDAFYSYLKGLDVRARLDIVATYLDQNLSDGSLSTLHVLGRTYGHPHKYFYRTYAMGTWSGWIAVTPEIDGDHIVLAVWKGRVNIFWVKFILQSQPPPAGSTGLGNVMGLSFDQLAGGINDAKATQQVKPQLYWAEYFQGKWTTPIATDPNSTAAVLVNDGFDASNVYIHVSKELDTSGNEGAVRIHLDFPPVYGPWSLFGNLSLGDRSTDRMLMSFSSPAQQIHITPRQVQIGGGGYAFRVTSKNCVPDFAQSYWQPAAPNPYSSKDVHATLYDGGSALSATFETDVQNSGSGTSDTEFILQTVNSFGVLACSNPVIPDPFLDQTEPLYNQAGALVSPFFFKDTGNPNATPTSFADELTFFVQPTLKEKTIDQWNGWAIAPRTPAQDWTDPSIVNNIPVIAQVPVAELNPINPGDPINSVFTMQNATDWVTDPATALSFGGSLIGKGGGVEVASLGLAAGLAASVSSLSNAALDRSGLTVVGSQGISLSRLQAAKTTSTSSMLSGFTTLRKTF